MSRLVFLLDLDPDVFASLASDLDWSETELDPDSYDWEDYPARLWAVPGGQVRFVDDTVAQAQYVDIDATPAEPVAEAILREFTAYDRDGLRAALDLSGETEAVTRTLRRLACASASTPFDQQVYDVTVEALGDEREDVRIAALKVVNYTSWYEFLPTVTRLAADHGNRRVRGFAASSKLLVELTRKIESEQRD